MFTKVETQICGKSAILVTGLGKYSLADTLECGQCFRHWPVIQSDEYTEYVTVVGKHLLRVAQRERGELIFYGISDEVFESVVRPYFTLDTDYESICRDICSRTDSAWLIDAAKCGEGIAILKQDGWEALFSFIISQNNNIPRIRKIIREICAEYGVNLTLQCGDGAECPIDALNTTPCEEKCGKCGICYTFPTPEDIHNRPEGLLPSRPGFRYRYLTDAAERVFDGRCNLVELNSLHAYEECVTELKKIVGVGDKVASCVALFGLGCLDAFPIDVWMKRAIDTYFDGKLDVEALGSWRGIAQQYIFNYIRNNAQNP